jgi:hypothetical protein
VRPKRVKTPQPDQVGLNLETCLSSSLSDLPPLENHP